MSIHLIRKSEIDFKESLEDLLTLKTEGVGVLRPFLCHPVNTHQNFLCFYEPTWSRTHTRCLCRPVNTHYTNVLFLWANMITHAYKMSCAVLRTHTEKLLCSFEPQWSRTHTQLTCCFMIFDFWFLILLLCIPARAHIRTYALFVHKSQPAHALILSYAQVCLQEPTCTRAHKTACISLFVRSNLYTRTQNCMHQFVCKS